MASFPPINELVPHRGRMLLIDEVVDWGKEFTVVHLEVRENNLFVRDGVVDPVVGLEYMSQAVAAWAGMSAANANRPVRLGYIIGCRSLKNYVEAFRVGQKILVNVQRTWGDLELGVFNCSMHEGDSLLSEATLTVYQEPEKPMEDRKIKDTL